MDHSFTGKIKEILADRFGKQSEEIFEKSQLLQYINIKTRSAHKGAKARSSFANLYAIYVLIEDYLRNKFDKTGGYSKYDGALFVKLFQRQRELPFGSKLQNHALNNRMNAEFQKYFSASEYIPILRNLESNRYWINETLIKVTVGKKTFNLAQSIIDIIDEYSKTKRDAFDRFIRNCKALQEVESKEPSQVKDFISSLIAPNVDARVFEIVSYAILKYYYHDQKIYWGFEIDKLMKDNLKLFKTGRTNANDGGIDFVMKPLGRFFQVTETLDVKKYFLDIEKIERYPLTFVIKSEDSVEELTRYLKAQAMKLYTVKAMVNKFMCCIEEIINIPMLNKRFSEAARQGYLIDILEEIIKQSKVEFNYDEDEEENE